MQNVNLFGLQELSELVAPDLEDTPHRQRLDVDLMKAPMEVLCEWAAPKQVRLCMP